MPRLIDVDALNEFLKGSFQTENIRSGDNDGYFFQKGWNDAIKFILTSVEKKLTIEDFEPVRHGRWIIEMDDLGWLKYTCPNCGYVKRTDIHVSLGWNYCPNCGTKMDLEG